MNLDTSIADINFYCKKIAKRLNNLELKTARDLLFYYPFRYEDWSKIKKISELVPNEPATVKVKIEQIKNFRSPRMHKKITEAIVRDETGKIKVLWFNQWYITNALTSGDDIYLAAKMNDDGDIVSPGYAKFSENATHTGRIVPIYPLTQGLTQKHIRSAVKSALEIISASPPFQGGVGGGYRNTQPYPASPLKGEGLNDYLPDEIKEKNNLMDLKNAVLNIHFPASEDLRQGAVRRLSFDELFFAQLKNLWLKYDLEKRAAAPIIFHKEETAKFVDKLPFKLTEAQRKAAWEILKDIGEAHPMNRLLDGDVGSGKTLVAALAIYNTALSGMQSALLAPTEILATQHYNTFCKLFSNLKIGLFTRSKKITNYSSGLPKSLPASLLQREKITLNSDIIIGTHALIQEDVKFNNLALVVIDEQHRFGVEQRACLANGNTIFPHLLSMTATPIPRTLSLISYGDLDLSILDQMPQGRKIIKTYAVTQAKRAGAYGFIRKQIKDGRQAFVICPLIDESDKLGVKSVTEEYKKLNEQIFPEFQIGMLHGKLKSAEKDEVMLKFKDNKINILVSTSVIEVGVDIPNATIMMIEGAERFGLAQLHQFRGRVGRSIHQSYCLLFPTDNSTSRLKAMETINDGFRLAEIDLQIRGPGKIYGTEQSGKLEFRLADIKNITLMKQTRDAANNLIQSDPELKKYPHLREYLEERLKKIHLE